MQDDGTGINSSKERILDTNKPSQTDLQSVRSGWHAIVTDIENKEGGATLEKVMRAVAAIENLSESEIAEVRNASHEADDGTILAMIVGLVTESLTPTMLDTATTICESLHEERRLDDEVALMSRVSKVLPSFHWPWFVLGRVELEKNRPSEAEVFFAKAIECEKNFAWSHVLIARSQILLKRKEEAAEHISLALSLMPNLRLEILEDRIALLSKVKWSNLHSEVLKEIFSLGAPSRDTCTQTLSLFADILAQDRWGARNATECIADIEHFIGDDDISGDFDFQLLPIVYMVALSVAFREPSRANALLAAFGRRMPEQLSPHNLPSNFFSVMKSSTTFFLLSLSVENTALSEDLRSVCMRVAELQLGVMRDPTMARMLSEALSAPQGLSLRSLSLFLQSYRVEDKWFEVLNLLRDRPLEEIFSSKLVLNTYVAAIEEVTTDTPELKLRAARHLVETIEGAENPEETTDGLMETLYKLLSESQNERYNSLKALAVAGDAQEALEAWERSLSEFCGLVKRCEELMSPGTPDFMSDASWGGVPILTSPYLPQVLHYRGEQLSELLEGAGVRAPLIDLVSTPISSLQHRIIGAQAVVLQRQPATFEVIRFIIWCRRFGIRTIHDIDDQIFDSRISPLPLSDYAGRIDHNTHVHLQFDCAYFREAISYCDEVIVSTETLREQVRAAVSDVKAIHLRRNMVGEPLRVARIEALSACASASKEDDVLLEVLYGSGTKAHKSYFDETVMPGLVEVAQQNPNIRFSLLGEFDVSSVPQDVAAQFTCETKWLNYPDYLRRLACSDISIAPLNSNPVTDGKSELKWLEAACLGIPSIVSPTANYRDTLVEGTHVLFADTREDWVRALTHLAADVELRKQLVRNSEALIEKDYEVNSQAHAVAEMLRLHRTSRHPRTLVNRKTRLLVVNTYFYPQSIGGATRIAENYAMDIVRRYGDRFEVFALCADALNRKGNPYSLNFSRHGGVTVIRCSIPERDWADAKDSNVERLTEQLVRTLKIDVAHVHSVQVLTASVVDGLARAGVPILLSLHDAWWLSEHQFLVDEDGTPFTPKPNGADLASTKCRRMSIQARMRRRSILAGVMRHCRQILAVSDVFADVYREAGIPNVKTFENGVSFPSNIPPKPTVDSNAPLRVGFIGGLSAHKGFRLLERVAWGETLDNIEFVLVDHRYDEGYEREDIWGASRVTYVGKTLQSRVGKLYARFDILAAPSIWPESYGLVAREARAHGVPVIAGNRGDIGRGIAEGRDGWVVDVSDDHDLRKLLLRLNSEPELARLQPTVPKVVSVQDAVDRLVQMYDAEVK